MNDPTVANIQEAVRGIDRNDYVKLVEAVRSVFADPSRDAVQCVKDVITADYANFEREDVEGIG